MENENKRPLTIYDIAKELGLSKSAVSAAFTGKGNITQQTRERIVHDAKRLGYRPNAAAKSVSGGRFNSIALLTEGYGYGMPWGLLQGAGDELSEHKMQLVFAHPTKEALANSEYMPKILTERSVDGLLIHYLHSFPSKMRDLIEQYHIPAVWYNMKFDLDSVYPDDFNAAADATKYLLNLGHHRIAYIKCLELGHFSETERQRGYEHTMAEAGLVPQIVSQHTAGEEIDICREIFDQPERPTAILAYEMYTAGPAFVAARSLGLAVPDDLSIIAISDNVHNDFRLPLTTMRIPTLDMGRIAIRMLVEKINQGNTPMPSQAVVVPMQDEGTCTKLRM